MPSTKLGSSLDETMNRLFETELGIKGEHVTLEYIRDARATRRYSPDDSSDFGGRTDEGLTAVDEDEAREILRELDEFVDQYASRTGQP